MKSNYQFIMTILLVLFSCTNSEKLSEDEMFGKIKLKDPYEYFYKIGYFDLITDKDKLKAIKELMNKSFDDDKWVYIPSEDYVTEVSKTTRSNIGYNTADLRSVELSPDMIGESFMDYLKEFTVIFEKRNFKFAIANEVINWGKRTSGNQTLFHSIEINGKKYKLFDGNVELVRPHPATIYIENLAKALNDCLIMQGSNQYFILFGSQESVRLMLIDDKMKNLLYKVKDQMNNYFEEF